MTEDTVSQPPTEPGKKVWQSKTFWANMVMAGALVLQSYTGFVIGPELQALAVTAINLFLRKITREPVVW